MSQYGIVCEQNVFCYLNFQLQKALPTPKLPQKNQALWSLILLEIAV